MARSEAPPAKLLVSFLVFCAFWPVCLYSAVSRDFVVDLKATVSGTSPHIALFWSQRLQGNISAQAIHRRVAGEASWVLQQTLTTTQTNYIDATAVPGVQYEYWMQRTLTNVNPGTAMGYASAGLNVPMIDNRGKLLLLVDDTMATPLAPEVSQLEQDLAGDGWTVQTILAGRTNTPPEIRALIQAAYNADPTNVKMVYLLGHVPVPYSGNLAPDGHGDHFGAWPADGYYGDLNGTWTDTTVSNVSASRAENDNVPGDGKFDQSSLPSLLEIGVGRVDLRGMTKAPSANVTETVLLRRYLRKAHEYKHRLGAYADVPRRTLIRDGFGHAFSSEPFAISGWALAFSGAGQGSSTPIDEAPSGMWFSPEYAGTNVYLTGYGCGGGSYESASSVGTSTDFGRKPSHVVFTSLFGSYHGDWDAGNCFLRAPLAGNATGDSLGLICYWAGRPNWFMYQMGMGGTAGRSALTSMNNRSGSTDHTPDGSSVGYVHLGLMGDPALRLHMVEPPRGLTAVSSGGQVQLTWDASAESGLLGYHVYRGDSSLGPFSRLTPSAQAATSYTDAGVTNGQTYTYLVRTLKLESVPGGTYQNLSCASAATVVAGTTTTAAPSELAVAQATGAGVQLTWDDNSADETGFRVERRTNADGSYGTVGTVGANITGFLDPGPFAGGNVYYYRVIATGPAGDSPPSNEASFEAFSGYFDVAATTIKVAKNAGSATIMVNRFGGNVGTTTVNYATANSSATGGVHYTTTNGSLVWTNGESAPKAITVPIINTPSPQLPRQFKVNLTGTGVAVASGAAVLIEDTGATLAAPWSQTMLGSVTDSSPAVTAEGSIGDATIGGSGVTSGATSEAGRFVYQSRTGDGVITAFVPDGIPSQNGARFAVMVRDALTGGSVMAAAVTSGDATGFGAKLAYRTTASDDATVMPAANNNHRTPRWLRLTRTGNSFFAESSSDGVNWTALGNQDVTMPSTCYWGLFHYSAALTSTTSMGDYQLAQFKNVTIADPPPPGTPTSLVVASAAPTEIQLSWATVAGAAGYRIERRDESGTFSQIADMAGIGGTTQIFIDDTVSPDSAYEYRITPYNGTGDGGSANITAATPRSDNVYTLTADDAGSGDAMVRHNAPDTVYGLHTKLAVAGPGSSGDLSAIQKTYLRFNLVGIPSILKSATLRMAFMSATRVSSWFYMSISLLGDEASDTWSESTITYNNAPQNNTNATLNPPTTYLAAYWLPSGSPAPAYGGVVSISIDETALDATGRGPNGLITLGLASSSQGDFFEWASGEHPTFLSPTLELIETSPLPTRPSFLTAAPGSGGIDVGWADNSDNETGFELERRALNGTFTLLQSLAQGTTTFFDGTALPGVFYEYRVRAAGAAGNSSWTPIASATALGAAGPYHSWLQANGLPMDGSGIGAPGATPANDGIANLIKFGLGLNPWSRGAGGRLSGGIMSDGGATYLSLTYVRPEPAPEGASYLVEASADLIGWSSTGVVEVSNVPGSGTRTITVRDGTAVSDAIRRFLRLRVTSP